MPTVNTESLSRLSFFLLLKSQFCTLVSEFFYLAFLKQNNLFCTFFFTNVQIRQMWYPSRLRVSPGSHRPVTENPSGLAFSS